MKPLKFYLPLLLTLLCGWACQKAPANGDGTDKNGIGVASDTEFSQNCTELAETFYANLATIIRAAESAVSTDSPLMAKLAAMTIETYDGRTVSYFELSPAERNAFIDFYTAEQAENLARKIELLPALGDYVARQNELVAEAITAHSSQTITAHGSGTKASGLTIDSAKALLADLADRMDALAVDSDFDLMASFDETKAIFGDSPYTFDDSSSNFDETTYIFGETTSTFDDTPYIFDDTTYIFDDTTYIFDDSQSIFDVTSSSFDDSTVIFDDSPSKFDDTKALDYPHDEYELPYEHVRELLVGKVKRGDMIIALPTYKHPKSPICLARTRYRFGHCEIFIKDLEAGTSLLEDVSIGARSHEGVTRQTLLNWCWRSYVIEVCETKTVQDADGSFHTEQVPVDNPQALAECVEKYEGSPYVPGYGFLIAENFAPESFNCMSLIWWCLKEAYGIDTAPWYARLVNTADVLFDEHIRIKIEVK